MIQGNQHTIELFTPAFLRRLLHELGVCLALLFDRLPLLLLAPGLNLLKFLLCLLPLRVLSLEDSAIVVSDIVFGALLQDFSKHSLVRLRAWNAILAAFFTFALASLLSALLALITSSLLINVLPQKLLLLELLLRDQAIVEPLRSYNVHLAAVVIGL